MPLSFRVDSPHAPFGFGHLRSRTTRTSIATPDSLRRSPGLGSPADEGTCVQLQTWVALLQTAIGREFLAQHPGVETWQPCSCLPG